MFMAANLALLALLANVRVILCDSSTSEVASVTNKACLLQKGRSFAAKQSLKTSVQEDTPANASILSTAPVAPIVHDVIEKPKNVHTSDAEALLSAEVKGSANAPKAAADMFPEKEAEERGEAAPTPTGSATDLPAGDAFAEQAAEAAAGMAAAAAKAAAQKAAVAAVAKAGAEMAAVAAETSEKVALDEAEKAAGESEAAIQAHAHSSSADDMPASFQNDSDVRLAQDTSAPASERAEANKLSNVPGYELSNVLSAAPASEKAEENQSSTVQSLAAGIGCLAAAILICAAPLICKFW